MVPSESNARACARDVGRVSRSRGKLRVVAVVVAAATVAPSLTAAGDGDGGAPPATGKGGDSDDRGECRPCVCARTGAGGVRAARTPDDDDDNDDKRR